MTTVTKVKYLTIHETDNGGREITIHPAGMKLPPCILAEALIGSLMVSLRGEEAA